jgi:hypothetical protein
MWELHSAVGFWGFCFVLGWAVTGAVLVAATERWAERGFCSGAHPHSASRTLAGMLNRSNEVIANVQSHSGDLITKVIVSASGQPKDQNELTRQVKTVYKSFTIFLQLGTNSSRTVLIYRL